MINLASILIKIEIKRGGDHEEFKISLSNRLIPSRFNQELRRKAEYIVLYQGNSTSNVGHPFRDVIYVVRSRKAVGIVAHDAVQILLK